MIDTRPIQTAFSGRDNLLKIYHDLNLLGRPSVQAMIRIHSDYLLLMTAWTTHPTDANELAVHRCRVDEKYVFAQLLADLGAVAHAQMRGNRPT